MSHFAVLNGQLAFAPQITAEDVSEFAKLGYQQMICNRPDGEEPYQPQAIDIKNAAKKHHIHFVFAPVANGQFTPSTIKATEEALANGKKTLIFCRSGTRSSILWAIIQVRAGKNIDDVFAQTASIGYDIAYLRDFIVTMAQQ